MGSGIMDKQQIPFVDPGKHPVNSEFVIVFTERTCHIIHMVTGGILFSHNGQMMVGPIHSRPHKVYGTGIAANVFFVGMLLMDCLCHQGAVRPHHKASQLCIESHIPHPCRDKDFLIYFADSFPNHTDIIGLLIRAVRDSDSTGKIDKTNMGAGLSLKLNRNLKKYLCQHGIILIRHSIAGQESVNAKFLCSLCL